MDGDQGNERPASQADRLNGRLRRWDNRITTRLSSWSVRRRWVAVVLLPSMLLCCCGTAIGVPVTWFLRETAKASAGAASPDAAVNVYLMGLGYNREDGLLPMLDDDQGDALITQWRTYRAEMERGDSAPSRLEFTFNSVAETDERHAVVAAEVYPVWWDKNGGGTSLNGTRHTWKFSVREESGWQISHVEPYPWCGGYVRDAVCK